MKTLFNLLVLFTAFSAQAAFGEYASAVQITGSSTVIYNMTGSGLNCINLDCGVQLNGASLGSYVINSGTLNLNGGEIKTWKDGWSNVCGGTVYYTVYPTGARPGSPVFSPLSIGFKAACGGTLFTDGFGPCGGNDQKWGDFTHSADLTNFAAGNYSLEIYFEFSGNNSSTSGCGDLQYISNGGFNYVATFTLTNPPSGLPVELVSFSANCSSNEVAVEWTTASEFNSAYFEVEKSDDALTWYSVGVIDAATFSSLPITYSFQAEENRTFVYYRLKQVDLNGDFTYYSPIYIHCGNPDEVQLYCFSDGNNTLFCTFSQSLSEKEMYEAKLYSLHGQLIQQLDFEIQDGSIVFQFEGSISTGMYFVRINDLHQNPIGAVKVVR